ncbi:hypothetical protein HPB50_009116 [Hyalomma asiaticum]|uniref:Uncharacterized protein n=1 Tax=Hyalomma asiaticum TaxID=266040 RepID=A0ACB7T079_HYAAI|nr:hypothetical protein HPB50_009116 [Hyalomma asiaticum]
MTLEANHIRAIGNSSPHASSGSPNAFTTDAWRSLEQRWQSSLGTIFPGRVHDNTKLTYATVDQAWFERLLALIVANESTLVLMLGWRVAQYASQYVNRDLALGYYKDDKEPTKSYLDHCFDLFSDHMGLASIKDYVAKHFTKDSRDDLIHIARGVRRIFFEKLTDSSYDWKNVSALYGLLESSQSASLNEEFLQLPTMSASFPDNLRRVRVLLQDNPDVATAIYAHRLSSDLYRSTSYYFHKGKEGSVTYAMLPLALNFPFYEPDAPLAVRYLEGLEDLSPHQLFFVAIVYRHCGGADVSYGNAMLRLMSGFSEAYGCGKDSPMRGAEFCDQMD